MQKSERMPHAYSSQADLNNHTYAEQKIMQLRSTQVLEVRLVFRSRGKVIVCPLICSHTKAVRRARTRRQKQGGSSSTLIGLEPDLHILKGSVESKPAKVQ